MLVVVVVGRVWLLCVVFGVFVGGVLCVVCGLLISAVTFLVLLLVLLMLL